MATVPFVWSNDDITVGLAANLEREVEFIDRLGIKGVFFVVPRSGGKTIDQDADLLRAIEKARGRGHEFYQHGYEHGPFECGVPETWMLDFAPDVRNEYDVRRLEIEKLHTLDAQVRSIEAGRAIWRKAFGEDSAGFRPPWGGFCTSFYQALDILGFRWVSSRIPNATSWLWNNGKWDAPKGFREGVPACPTRIGRLIEFILGGDYAFRVPDDQTRMAQMVDLAMWEMSYLHERGWPMIIVSHWHGLEHAGGTGYAVHEKLLPALLGSGRIEAMNMTGLEGWVREDERRVRAA